MLAYDQDEITNPSIKNRVRLIDFGGAKTFDEKFISGSIDYMSLEALELHKRKRLNMEADFSSFDCRKEDVWSLGILFHTISMGYNDFDITSSLRREYQPDAIEERISYINDRIKVLMNEHGAFNDLLQQILTVNENRINLSEILKHPYFEEDNKPTWFRRFRNLFLSSWKWPETKYNI